MNDNAQSNNILVDQSLWGTFKEQHFYWERNKREWNLEIFRNGNLGGRMKTGTGTIKNTILVLVLLCSSVLFQSFLLERSVNKQKQNFSKFSGTKTNRSKMFVFLHHYSKINLFYLLFIPIRLIKKKKNST